MKLIPLDTKAIKFAQVDDTDYDGLVQFSWACNTWGYAVRRFKETVNDKVIQRAVKMHRQIMNPPKRYDVDHLDGNRLNNQRSNLRLVTQHQNCMNRSKNKAKCSSQFIGVSKLKQYDSWKAQIKLNKRTYYLGHYDNEHIAAVMRDFWAKEMFGDHAKTNFEVVAFG